jgi:hypothetical protein
MRDDQKDEGGEKGEHPGRSNLAKEERYRRVIGVESESSVGVKENFGRHPEEVAVVVVGKTEKESSEQCENVEGKVDESESEGGPGCQKSVVGEVANPVEDWEIHHEFRHGFFDF